MSISSELTALQQDITNARTKITEKGGTITPSGGSSQLATDIATIPTGITPSGNIALTATTSTQTGINVTNYATASVAPTPSESKTLTLGSSAPSTVSPSSGKLLSSVPVSIDNTVIKAENIAQGATILGIAGTHAGGGVNFGNYKINSNNQIVLNDLDFTGLFDNVVSVADYAFSSTYQAQSNAAAQTALHGTVSFPNAVSFGKYSFSFAFRWQKGNLSVGSFDSVTSVNEYSFQASFYQTNATGTFSFNGLTSISNQYVFSTTLRESKVASISFANLQTVPNTAAYAFNYFAYQNTALTTISFPLLEDIGANNFLYYAFYGCTNLKNVTMAIKYVKKGGALSYAFYGCTKLNVNDVIRTIEEVEDQSMNNCFRNCTGMNNKQIIFKSLKKISTSGLSSSSCLAYAFNGISGINMWFPVLYQMGNLSVQSNALLSYNMTSTTVLGTSGEMYFPELTIMGNSSTASNTNAIFASSAQLRKVYMPKVSTAGTGGYWFYSNTNMKELHFGIENETAVRSFPQFANRFGAPAACTIYFDLVNHITVNGTVYNRDGEHYIVDELIANSANNLYSWKDENGNILYTKNAWTPAVGDATYDSSGVSTGNTITAVS